VKSPATRSLSEGRLPARVNSAAHFWSASGLPLSRLLPWPARNPLIVLTLARLSSLRLWKTRVLQGQES